MYNMYDDELFKTLVNLKDKDAYIVPICVKIYNEYYGLYELDQIQSYDPSFKVVYGGLQSVLTRCKFPNAFMLDFPVVKQLSETDEDTGSITKFIAIETGYVEDLSTYQEIKEYMNQIHESLQNRIKKHCEAIRKARISNMMDQQ